MFYDRIQDAQQSIKASMSANADESLAGSEGIEHKDSIKDETDYKGMDSFVIYSMFIISVLLRPLLLSVGNYDSSVYSIAKVPSR